MHNLLLDHRVFDGVVAELSQTCRVVTVDLRGHGESRGTTRSFSVPDLADDLVAILDAVGAERAVVVGVSLGASSALELAVTHPDRVRALMLMGASPFAASLSDKVQNVALGLAVRLFGTQSALIGQVIPILFGESFRAAEPEIVATWKSRIRALDKRDLWRGVRSWIGRPSRLEALSRVTCPTLVVLGGEDIACPPAVGQKLADGIPGARLEQLDSAGHSVPVEQPDGVLRLLQGLLSEVEGSLPDSIPSKQEEPGEGEVQASP